MFSSKKSTNLLKEKDLTSMSDQEWKQQMLHAIMEMNKKLSQLVENTNRLLEQAPSTISSLPSSQTSEKNISRKWRQQQESEAREYWKQIVKEIEHRIAPSSYETWFAPTEGITFTNQRELIVWCPNEFARDWLVSRYTNFIEEVCKELTGRIIQMKFITDESE